MAARVSYWTEKHQQQQQNQQQCHHIQKKDSGNEARLWLHSRILWKTLRPRWNRLGIMRMMFSRCFLFCTRIRLFFVFHHPSLYLDSCCFHLWHSYVCSFIRSIFLFIFHSFRATANNVLSFSYERKINAIALEWMGVRNFYINSCTERHMYVADTGTYA